MAGIGVAFGGDLRDVHESQELLSWLVEQRFASRLFAQDATLWGSAAEAEAAIRLGWVDFEADARALIPEIQRLRERLRALGVDRIVLCGMGGSSLATAVIAHWAGAPLTVLDSTHPDAVRAALGTSEALARTAVVVSSKSGSTIETLSHLATFSEAFTAAGIPPAERIVIVTDPDSPLAHSSRAAGHQIVHANPHVGGRFSALTAFGLLPAGLAGADLHGLLADAVRARKDLAQDRHGNPALQLAACLAAGLPTREVLATRVSGGAAWGLAAWVEQLLAESTGKQGTGILPIALPSGAHEFTHTPPNTTRLLLAGGSHTTPPFATHSAQEVAQAELARVKDQGIVVAADLGAQLLLWEVATAALGALLQIDPFTQPDVESSKSATRKLLAGAAQQSLPAAPHSLIDDDATPPEQVIRHLHRELQANGYLVLQAFLHQGGTCTEALEQLRERCARYFAVPVALCWGPSYLHSTGQLHKGGSPHGVFVQLTDAAMSALPIPGSTHGFETLLLAQARGDLEVLRARGRTVISLTSEHPKEFVERLIRELDKFFSQTA